MDKLLRSRLISLIDLTNLNEDATKHDILNLCEKANTSLGPVAAICIYPKFIATVAAAVKVYNPKIAVCTVVNFLTGTEQPETIYAAITTSLQAGADEIDLVLPYQDYLAGKTASALNLVEQCRKLIPADKLLKVILETGAFADTKQLYSLSRELIDRNVDFLKTSTGKIPVGATIEAATALLRAIKDSAKDVGLKASGGIRTVEQAVSYYNLAEEFFPDHWLTAKHFRLGASSLLDHLLE